MTIDPETIAVYDAKAHDYATQFDSGGKPGAHLRRFMAALPTGGRALDLGCGPAGSARHMIDAGFEVSAFDASPEMIRVAKEVNGVTGTVATFDDLTEVDAYDGIWANFSLLHAPRDTLPRHLAAIAAALRPNGVFHIGMKVGDGTARDGIARLYTYVTRDELCGLLTHAGFDIVAEDHGTEVGLAGTADPWIVFMARKNG